MCPLCMWHTRAAQACVSWSLPANFIEVMQRERCCAQLQPCPGDEVRLCCAQDAIVLARTLRDALGGSGSPSLKQQTLVKVDEALRNFERERTRRKLKISVKSNLMGAALQIPFAPVNNLGAPIMCSRYAISCYARRPTIAVWRHCCPITGMHYTNDTSDCSSLAQHHLTLLQVVAARNYAVENILSTKGVLDHAMYDCGTL